MAEREHPDTFLQALRKAIHRPSAEELAARESELRGYVLEALGQLGESEWPSIRSKIDALHPVPQPGHFWGRGTQITPKGMLRLLSGMEEAKLVISRSVIDPPNEFRRIPFKRTLWKIAPQEAISPAGTPTEK
jgi:hypothetical protein